jgi:hypothetical protein
MVLLKAIVNKIRLAAIGRREKSLEAKAEGLTVLDEQESKGSIPQALAFVEMTVIAILSQLRTSTRRHKASLLAFCAGNRATHGQPCPALRMHESAMPKTPATAATEQ